MLYKKLFSYLLFIPFFLMSCLIERVALKEFPYTINFRGVVYKGNFSYLDSLNQIGFDMNAAYIPQKTNSFSVYLRFVFTNFNNQNILIDTSSITLESEFYEKKLVHTEPKNFSLVGNDEGEIDYVFLLKSKQINKSLDEPDQIFLDLNTLVGSKYINILNDLSLTKN